MRRKRVRPIPARASLVQKGALKPRVVLYSVSDLPWPPSMSYRESVPSSGKTSAPASAPWWSCEEDEDEPNLELSSWRGARVAGRALRAARSALLRRREGDIPVQGRRGRRDKGGVEGRRPTSALPVHGAQNMRCRCCGEHEANVGATYSHTEATSQLVAFLTSCKRSSVAAKRLDEGAKEP